MALTSTMYTFEITLADSDRDVYQSFKCAVAKHPSETSEFMLTRLMAFCLEFEEGICFSKGLSEPDEPAVWTKHLDGRLKTWIEVGVPAAERLHKAAKAAERVAVYTHRDPEILLRQLAGKKIHRGGEIPIYSFEPDFLGQFSTLIDRRTAMNVSIAGRQAYVGIGDVTLSTSIDERVFPVGT